MNVLPITDLTTMKLIKGYFSLFNKNLDSKLRTKKFSTTFRRRSQNKIFVSNGEFKHTNNKLTIGLYLFNRQKNNLDVAMNKLKIFYLKKLFFYKKFFSQRLALIENVSFKGSENEQFHTSNKKLFLIKNLYKNVFSKMTSGYISICIKNFFDSVFKSEYDKTLHYFSYIQMAYINQSKYTYSYLQHLKKLLYDLYNKQVEFNLINLRHFYLNSDILLESFIGKISKNRKKMSILVKKLCEKVIVSEKSFSRKYIVNNLSTKKVLSENNEHLIDLLKDMLKYKHVTGFRLEAKGRLTKRYTASRSVLKIAQVGSLSNMESSWSGLSSVLLKGNLDSNLLFAKLTSKSRIGAFGLKAWVSSN